jgi:squalene-hopene/tetraprenyl-beta-curcumene cyclase
VPDADDTAGALIALKKLGEPDGETLEAAERGVRWLLDVQNSDGGVPTFCKGWGELPFDRSCPDITAHALRALIVWRGCFNPFLNGRIERFANTALKYLDRSRSSDGSWSPLWFGSQYTPDNDNPVFGTAKVAVALADAVAAGVGGGAVARMLRGALSFLREARNPDGGWGAAAGVESTVEETSVAVTALSSSAEFAEFAKSGEEWLRKRIAETGDGDELPAAPIGLYFASLWYSEKLYPLVFALEALRHCGADRESLWKNG